MRHVQSVTLRQHAKLKTQVTQVLNPLHLVAAVVDEAFIKVRQLVPASDHDVGLPVALVEALDGRVLGGLGQPSPVVGNNVLLLTSNAWAYMITHSISELRAVFTLDALDQILLCFGVVFNGATSHHRPSALRFDTRFQILAILGIQHALGKEEGGNNHDVVGVGVKPSWQVHQSGVRVV